MNICFSIKGKLIQFEQIHLYTNPLLNNTEICIFRTPIRYVLFAIDIMCLLISHCILIAVVMNYVCYCEMIVFYGKAIRTKLEEKSIELHEAMKRILDLGASISQMNSSASRMMSVLLIFFLQRTILGK